MAMEEKTIKVLNLGAGVQSTTLFLLSIEGTEPEVPKFDFAVFADTQEEPEDVYKHLDWLDSLGGPKIIRTTQGRLGNAIENGSDSRGKKCKDGSLFITIPAFTVNPQTGVKSVVRRQCTAEYKVKPVEKAIRDWLGVQKGRPVPKSISIHQYMGISYDEPKRVIRIKERFLAKPSNWSVHFPLWKMQWDRADCRSYLKENVPHQVPRSACVFCPFKSDSEWRELKETNTAGWERAVHIDKACRNGVGLDAHRYLHQSCKPLDQVDLRPFDERRGQMSLLQGFQDECEGYCGN
jgi:hypothetical protein